LTFFWSRSSVWRIPLANLAVGFTRRNQVIDNTDRKIVDSS
jgi:hypothetical protein